MTNKFEQIIGLYGNEMDPEERRKLLEELRDPNSEAAKLLEAMRTLARAKIDLHQIPGMEEIAKWEDALSNQENGNSEPAS